MKRESAERAVKLYNDLEDLEKVKEEFEKTKQFHISSAAFINVPLSTSIAIEEGCKYFSAELERVKKELIAMGFEVP